MCEFHDCNCNGLGDIWWTDKCMYFSSIDVSELPHQSVQIQSYAEARCSKSYFLIEMRIRA